MFADTQAPSQEQYKAIRQRLGVPTEPIPIHRATEPEKPKPVPVPSSIQMPAKSWRTVFEQTMAKHGVSKQEMLGDGRTSRVVECRKECAFRMRRELGMTYPMIARRLNYKDHSGIVFAERAYAKANGLPIVGKTLEALARERAERNEIMYREVMNGKSYRSQAKKYDLAPNSVRHIVKSFGLDTGNVGSKPRTMDVSEQKMREYLHLLEEQKQQIKYLTQSFPSAAQASRFCGISGTTLLKRAKENGLSFGGGK